MFRQCLISGRLLCGAVVLPNTIDDKNGQSSWDRVVKIFTVSEFGEYSPEFTHIYQTTVLSFFVGACYGGFIESRKAYMDFIERNEATKFKHHFEAKKELQNYITVNFAKGALKWSWRIALFTGLYITFATALHTYRGEPSVFNYLYAGLLGGALYRINYGLRGLIVGGTLGSMIGLFGGFITLNLVQLTGQSFDDIYQLQEEQFNKRRRHIKEATEKSIDAEEHRVILAAHDRNIKGSQ